VKLVVSTVASNLKDCAPFASRHTGRLQENTAWESLYQSGARAGQTGCPGVAVSNFLAAAKLDGAYADLEFRLGRGWLALTNRAAAQRCLEAARDCDALPFRADTRVNEIIRQSGGRAEGIRPVDAVGALAAASPEGIPGNELLFEHVHLNFAGNYLLARSVADQVKAALPQAVTRTDRGEWASADECNERLGLTDWDRRRVLENMLRRLAEAPFVNQLNHREQTAALSQTLAEIRKRLTPETAKQASAIYQRAIAAEPDDFLLHAGLAKLREDTADLPGAVTEWERVRELLPLEPGPWYFAGKALARAGKSEEALASLSRALELHPGLVEALDEKGPLLVKLGQAAEALPLLEEAARIEPQNPRICMHRAEALAVLGRRPEALSQLRQAVRLQPANGEARYLLGVELAVDGDVRPAAEQFLEVIRLNPNHTLAHLNLGIAQAKMGLTEQAIAQFEETLRLDPNNPKAAEYLKALKREARKRAGQQ
jgi:tetratricopeptide (TPR) repeat protein